MWNSNEMLVFVYICLDENQMGAIIFLYAVVLIWICISAWTVIQISKYPYKAKTKKLIWTNIVVLFPFFGLIVYHLIGKKNLASS